MRRALVGERLREAPRQFLLAMACIWIALFIVASILGKHLGATWIWTAALPAFVLETLFYVSSIMEDTRQGFASAVRAPVRQAAALWVSALLPYIVLAAGTKNLNWRAFLLLACLCAVFTFWYVVLPHRPAFDAGFLVVAAAPVITRVFARIYVTPVQKLHLDVLGHLMWIRVGLIALLLFRNWNPGPVSFWPRRREWRIGVLWFGAALVPLVLVSYAAKDLHLVAPVWSWKVAGVALGTFFGGLWVVALSEELFFRGFIERALLDTRYLHPAVAVMVSAVLFGAVHLWVGQFPNYRRVATVIVLGVFCGISYWQSRSIRASMVTHACAIVTMRLFFR